MITAARRLFDFTVAALALLGLAPLLAVIALAVRAASPGPALHRARRVGMGGRPFTLYKFRSMVAGAATPGPGITREGDPRITPLGHWLRRLKLDELPQLLNVLRGEMSLVGPRPEDPRYVALYTPEQRRVLSARPGITSPASLRYRHEQSLLSGEDWEEHYRSVVMPHKLSIELDYLSRRTWASDLLIIAQTVLALFQDSPAPLPRPPASTAGATKPTPD